LVNLFKPQKKKRMPQYAPTRWMLFSYWYGVIS